MRTEPERTGTIRLDPIVATLTAEHVADMQANPEAFADMLRRAEQITGGSHEQRVPANEFFDSLDQYHQARHCPLTPGTHCVKETRCY